MYQSHQRTPTLFLKLTTRGFEFIVSTSDAAQVGATCLVCAWCVSAVKTFFLISLPSLSISTVRVLSQSCCKYIVFLVGR